jgi:hypothetical protein
MTSSSYLGHNGLPIFAFDVAEGHFRALVLVDLQLWVVDEGDSVDRYCALSVTAAVTHKHAQATSVLDYDSRHTNSCVGRHLHWSQATSLIALFAQFRGAIYSEEHVSYSVGCASQISYHLPRGGSSPARISVRISTPTNCLCTHQGSRQTERLQRYHHHLGSSPCLPQDQGGTLCLSCRHRSPRYLLSRY